MKARVTLYLGEDDIDLSVYTEINIPCVVPVNSNLCIPDKELDRMGEELNKKYNIHDKPIYKVFCGEEDAVFGWACGCSYIHEYYIDASGGDENGILYIVLCNKPLEDM